MPSFKSFYRWCLLKRARVILFVSIILLARLFYPQIKVDIISILLILVIVFAYYWDTTKKLLLAIMPHINQVEILGLRIEVKELGHMMEKFINSTNEANVIPGRIERKHIDDHKQSSDILHLSKTNPQAAFLLLSSRIEDVILKRYWSSGAIIPDIHHSNAMWAMQMGVKAGYYPLSVLDAFKRFWNIRNKVTHQAVYDVDDNTLYSLISIGIDLLKIVSR